MKIGYEDFFDFVWNEYISERVVPNSFLINNRDLIESITYDVYHVYEGQRNVSETTFAKVIEMFFSNIIKIGVEVVPKDNNIINDAFEGF